MKEALVSFGVVAMLIAGFGFLLNTSTKYPADDTDLNYQTRSGLRSRIDYLTGCQYLESVKGSITPRLDKTGRPMCSKD